MVYPYQTRQWRIQTVLVELGSFEDRKELQDAMGLDDAMFCHNGLFIADCTLFENTMKMAEMALDY